MKKIAKGWKSKKEIPALLFSLAFGLLPFSSRAQDINQEPLPQEELPSTTPAVPITPPTTVDEADAMAKTLYGAPDVPAEEPPNPEGQPARPWKFTLHGEVIAAYDSNIFITRRNPKSNYVFNLSPGFTFSWGDWKAQQESFVVVDYTLTQLLFVENPKEDAIEQEAVVDGQWRLAHFSIALHSTFEDLTSPDIDIGARTRRRLFRTGVIDRYDISDATYVEANFYNNISDYTTRLSSVEWIGRFWFNYKPTEKLTTGAGLSIGRLDVQHSPGQTFEQVLGRVIYAPTEKLSFEGDGGLEFRQIEGSDRVSPVFNIAGSYKPWEATEIKVAAYRKVENSASVAADNYTITGFSVEGKRTLRSGLDFVLAGGFNHSDYNGTTGHNVPLRIDNYFFIRPSLRFELARRMHIELFYEYQQNASTNLSTAFDDTQAGVEFRYDY